MMGCLCSLGTSQNKQPKIQRNTVISRYQRPTMIPHTRQQWRVFLVWLSGPDQRKMRGNPESRLFQQLKCTVRQLFLQLKLPIRVLPLYIKRCCGLNPVTMRVYVTRLVVFTTRAGENCPLGRLWPMCWGMKYRDSTGAVQTKRIKLAQIHWFS